MPPDFSPLELLLEGAIFCSLSLVPLAHPPAMS
jgi:hypothetical protein